MAPNITKEAIDFSNRTGMPLVKYMPQELREIGSIPPKRTRRDYRRRGSGTSKSSNTGKPFSTPDTRNTRTGKNL
jgi:hypothetical protein